MNVKDILYALQIGTMNSAEAEKELIRRIDAAAGQPPARVREEQAPAMEQAPVLPPGVPAESKVVEVQRIEPGIALVTMKDRENKNTFSIELIVGLFQAFHSIQANPDYKVIVLTGYDTYFASGGGKDGLLALHDGKMKMTDVHVYTLPLDCKIPVISAMQGHGIGGGWCFGMFSDFVVMSRESSYTCNHMKYGFTPGDGATLIFPEKLGPVLAQEILYTGNRFRGAELAAKGAPVPIVPRNEVMPYAIRLAKDLAEVPRESLMLMKEHMTEPIKKRITAVLEKEWGMQQKTFVNKPEVLQKILSVFEQSSPMTNAPELISLNRSTRGNPVFWLHGEGGGVEGYQYFAQRTGRPFYGIQAKGRMNADAPIHGLTAMAAYYVQLIRSLQPQGPYDLGGYSLGGLLAYETARQLQLSGQAVRSLVMLDTLDPHGMSKVAISEQGRMLQAVNLSLISRLRQGPDKLYPKLIHPEEINLDAPADELLLHLISLGKTRGLSITKSDSELAQIFRKNLQVQAAFKSEHFRVLPLPDPQAVSCYYFRNKNGKFYGDLEPYLTTLHDQLSVDRTAYWQEWERSLPDFQLIDVEASNHIALLFETGVCETIGGFCEQLYQ